MGVWRPLVDWEQKFAFDGDIDDLSPYWTDMSFDLGFSKMFQSVADETRCKIQLINADGRFNPENSSSPYYGYLVPFRLVRIQHADEVIYTDNNGDVMTDNNGDIMVEYANEQTVWTGWVDDISTDWEPAAVSTGKTKATLSCIGVKKYLQDTDISLPLYTETDEVEIIEDIINRVQLPPVSTKVALYDVPGRSEYDSAIYADPTDLYILDDPLLTIPYYGDRVPPNAWDALTDVVVSAQGRLFGDREGRIRYWNRHELPETQTVGGTISSTGTYKPINLDYGYGRHITTNVRVRVHPRMTGEGDEVLWSLDTPLEILPNDAKEIDVRLRKDDGTFTGGQNLTIANETYSTGSATSAVQSKGGRATITVTNNSSTQRAVLTDLDLVGQSIQNQNQLEIIREDATAVGNYGKRDQVSLDLTAVSSISEGEAIADFILGTRKDPFADLKYFELVRPDSDNSILFSLGMGTRVNVQIPEKNHNADHFIVGERWDVKYNHTRVMYMLEPQVLHDFALYDVGQYDVDRYHY